MSEEDRKYYKQLALDYGNGAKLNGYSAAVHLEADVDIVFWDKVFRHFLPQYSFDYITYSKTPKGKTATGCTVCLKYFELGCLSKDFFICIDSDYRWLLQEPNMDIEHFIFQTYTYSFENHYCYPKNIDNTFGKLGFKNDLFNFEPFLYNYSNILYELFLYHLLSVSKKDGLFNADDFNKFIGLVVSNLDEEQIISDLQNRVETKLCELKDKYTQTEIENVRNTCYNLGLKSDNAYLYFRGHTIFDQLVIRIIKTIKRLLENNISQDYTSEEKENYFSREQKAISDCLMEDIYFDKYPEINKIKADTEIYKQLYKN